MLDVDVCAYLGSYTTTLDILFRKYKFVWPFFCASDPLIDRFYKNLLIKGYLAQKQRLHELLRML